ncbi:MULTISPECIES: hypothetical protein [Rhizobiaceae]|uniref:hypothetical protein n=1 Tax=Rhizobiaceae TaxID=82115 RepID=UPI000FDAFB24|nr:MULTISPECIES: hypothetical protein [Rhizobiaceae]MBY3499336.1 hypothetical protein [Rhizobium laguerreae]RVJ12707.1 hypothetical protein CN181_03635 [Sinorhizobium medicae]
MREIEGIKEAMAVLHPYWDEIEGEFHRQNARYLELAAADHETIGRVLRAHLVVENFMNSYLPDFFGIEDFEELRLSFSQKAKLLPTRKSSAAFVRPGVIQLNAVRNKFGHRLNHEIKLHEIEAITNALKIARPGVDFANPIDAIEAFAPIACAFLSIPPKHLQEAFLEAFKNVRSYNPDE